MISPLSSTPQPSRQRPFIEIERESRGSHQLPLQHSESHNITNSDVGLHSCASTESSPGASFLPTHRIHPIPSSPIRFPHHRPQTAPPTLPRPFPLSRIKNRHQTIAHPLPPLQPSSKMHAYRYGWS